MHWVTRLWVALGLLATTPVRAWADTPTDAPAYPTSGFGHVDRSGLNEHVINSVVQGTSVGALYGLALTSNSDERSYSRVATGTLLGAAAGLVIPLVRNRGNKEVRSGDIIFINVAQNWGLAHGLLLPLMLGPEPTDWSPDTLRLTFGIAATSTLVAGGLAAQLTDELSFTPGQASAVGSAGVWGGLSGLALTVIARPNDPGETWARATIGVTLLAADVSMAMVWSRRDFFDIERSRVFMMNIGGALGAVVGLAGAYFIQPRLDNSRVVAGALLAGAAAGIATGYVFTEDWDDYKRSAPPLGATGLSLIEYHHGRIFAGVPMPNVTALTDTDGRARVRPMLSLASGSF